MLEQNKITVKDYKALEFETEVGESKNYKEVVSILQWRRNWPGYGESYNPHLHIFELEANGWEEG